MLRADSAVVIVPLALLLCCVFYILYGLLLNYNAARKTGLPLVILPVDCGNPLWLIIDRKVVQWVRHVPFGSGTFSRFNWRGWEIWDRCRAHEELGDGIMFVTPGKNYLQLCDAEAVSEIFRRRGDFPRPPESTEMLNIFGPNLGTTDGQQWQRHRRITASCFNEHINKRVWSESVRQATEMIRYWSSNPSIHSVAEDTRSVSLHVMSDAVFGKSYPFRGSGEPRLSSEDDSTSYGEALKLILDRCIPLVVLGRKNLSKSWLPKSFRELYQATVVFQEHMTKAYEDEKQATVRGENQVNNLMTALTRASQANASKKDTYAGSYQEGLTEGEIYGNIFVFNFAGHDATANSLALGISLLATRPDVQDWIADEINAVLAGVNSEESSYETVFPQLKRCLAVTFETVRLYTAVAIAKSTGSSPQPLKIGERTVIIPKNTMVIPNYSALHTHPRYWGKDSLEFEPSRWIISDPQSSGDVPGPTARFRAEKFKEPSKSNSPFVGWSGGARNCPGRKFSQVEFVGVLVGLFREYKVKPVPRAGEDDAMARVRLLEQIRKDTGMRLLLQMLHPEKVVLQWTRR